MKIQYSGLLNSSVEIKSLVQLYTCRDVFNFLDCELSEVPSTL